MKYALPLIVFTLFGFAADKPEVKSREAKALLKHPEFKKAMEAAPRFTREVLKELDKYVAKSSKKEAAKNEGRKKPEEVDKVQKALPDCIIYHDFKK